MSVRTDNLKRAVAAGVLSVEEASAVMERAWRHAGGRPEGSVQAGPDKLDRAVMALSVRRADMEPAELAESERRVTAMLTKPWNWKSRTVRILARVRGALREELDVVVQYKRSEDRVGMSRVRKFKAGARGIGAGYDPLVEDEPTKKEDAGKVKRQKPRKRKSRVGYPTEREPIVEKSLDGGEIMLWGTEVSKAVQQELGYEPVRRLRRGGRRWLEPVAMTAEFSLGERALEGAGLGENGRALPELLEDGSLSYAVEPTVGELHQRELERDPVKGLAYEPDGHRACRVPNPDGKAGEPMWFAVGSYRPRVKAVVAGVAWCAGHWRTGCYETRWRPAGLGIGEWLPPVGMLPMPVPEDPAVLAREEEIRAKRRLAERHCPFWDHGMGAFVPLWAVKVHRPAQVYHTTERGVLTPQIKAAVQSLYGRPLPRSPLLPR